MTKVEFSRKWLGTGKRNEEDLVNERLRDLTSVVDAERKAAKLDAFRIALKLYEHNPAAFPDVMASLIEAKPPKV